MSVTCRTHLHSVADPGFPVGGTWTSQGDVDSRSGYVSKILYVKTKESGPLGGVRRARPPRSANDIHLILTWKILKVQKHS